MAKSRDRAKDEKETGLRDPSFLPTQVNIPGIHEDLVGGWRSHSDERQDTVLLGHPEVAGRFTQGYDNRSMYLDDEPRREDLNYVSPEDIRKGSKSKYGF